MRKPTLEERKAKAIEIMKKMDIYHPYIEKFDKNNQITFFERGLGYWVNADSELYQRIKKIEEKYDLTVYTITHEYCEYVIDEWHDYDDKKNIFTDVLYHGCQSGMVGFLIWYSDTVAFYKEHQDEINELLYELMDDTGLYSIKDLFGDRWELEDPLALDCHNQNLLAWFGFEESLRNVGRQFEALEDYI